VVDDSSSRCGCWSGTDGNCDSSCHNIGEINEQDKMSCRISCMVVRDTRRFAKVQLLSETPAQGGRNSWRFGVGE